MLSTIQKNSRLLGAVHSGVVFTTDASLLFIMTPTTTLTVIKTSQYPLFSSALLLHRSWLGCFFCLYFHTDFNNFFSLSAFHFGNPPIYAESYEMIWSSSLIPLVSILRHLCLIVSVIFTDPTENCRSLSFFSVRFSCFCLCAQRTSVYMQVLSPCIVFGHSGRGGHLFTGVGST